MNFRGVQIISLSLKFSKSFFLQSDPRPQNKTKAINVSKGFSHAWPTYCFSCPSYPSCTQNREVVY